MEGKRATRGGWWVILLSFVLVVALAVTAAWRWSVAEEGTVNGERTTVYLDRVAAQMKAGTRVFNSDTVLTVDAKGLLTVMRIGIGEPTRLQQWNEKLHRVLPASVATRLPLPQSSTAGAAKRVFEQLYDHRSRTNSFVGLLSSLREDEAELLGFRILALGRVTPSDIPILEANIERFLASSHQGANAFAVNLQMNPALLQSPVKAAWFAQASRFATNISNYFYALMIPAFLRLKSVPDDLAEPILKPLSTSAEFAVRIEAKVELWRRSRRGESSEAFILGMSKEEPDLHIQGIELRLLLKAAESRDDTHFQWFRECASLAFGLRAVSKPGCPLPSTGGAKESSPQRELWVGFPEVRQAPEERQTLFCRSSGAHSTRPSNPGLTPRGYCLSLLRSFVQSCSKPASPGMPVLPVPRLSR